MPTRKPVLGRQPAVAAARLAEGAVRAGPLMLLRDAAAEFGVRIEPLLRKVGLPPDVFASPENIVPLDKSGHLTRLCAERTGQPHIALLAGLRMTPAHLGVVGLMMQNAATVEGAWRGLILNLHLNGRAVVPALAVRDDVALLSFTPFGRDLDHHDQTLDFTLASALALLRLQCGARWAPSEVRFAYRAPADTRPYRRALRAPVQFGAAQSGLMFSASWLGRPIKGANRQERLDLQQALRQMSGAQDIDLPTRVRRALFALISHDRVSIDAAAGVLGLHKRTLNRRLAADGTSFAALLGDVRFQLARQLLSLTDLPMVDIAATLNYTDASAFSRAFQSWARMSPSRWRQVNGGAAQH